MKNRLNEKLLLAVLLIATALLLAGCYAPTPTIEGDDYLEYPIPGATVSAQAGTATDGPEATGVVIISAPTETPVPTVNILPTATPILISTVQPVTPIPRTATPIPTATPRPTASPTPSVLKKGATGDAVRELQRALRNLGFYNGSVDGDFGEGTENAVKRFQTQYGLTSDGIAGAKTLSTLAGAKATARPTNSPTPKPTAKPAYNEKTYLRKGDSSTLVRKMQDRLIELGFLAGKATGDFDNCTEAGVRAFQNRNTSYTDGVAGKLTLDALFSTKASATSHAAAVIGITVQSGSEKAAVRAVQTRLKALGYYNGNTDGDFGTSTENAVKLYQSLNKLTADGKAGSATLNSLFAADAKTYAQVKPTATPRPTNPPTPRPTATPKPNNNNNNNNNNQNTPRPNPTATPKVYTEVTAAPNGDYVTLRRGNYGTPVRTMQRALKDQGYYTGDVDGYFGEGTENAVKSFQRAKGLDIDGVAGPATQIALFEGNFPKGS